MVSNATEDFLQELGLAGSRCRYIDNATAERAAGLLKKMGEANRTKVLLDLISSLRRVLRSGATTALKDDTHYITACAAIARMNGDRRQLEEWVRGVGNAILIDEPGGKIKVSLLIYAYLLDCTS